MKQVMKVSVQPKEWGTIFWKTGCTRKGIALTPAQAQFSLLGKTAACRAEETKIARGGIVVKTSSLNIVAVDIMQTKHRSLEQGRIG